MHMTYYLMMYHESRKLTSVQIWQLQEAVLVLYNLQQINMWRGHFFSSAVIKYFRWVKPTDSFSWKDHQWYCVKTCRAASGWQCDERLGGAETHVAQPISSELCNVRDEQMCAAVKDVCNNSAQSNIPPSCVGSRCRWCHPHCPPPPPCQQLAASLYSGEVYEI